MTQRENQRLAAQQRCKAGRNRRTYQAKSGSGQRFQALYMAKSSPTNGFRKVRFGVFNIEASVTRLLLMVRPTRRHLFGPALRHKRHTRMQGRGSADPNNFTRRQTKRRGFEPRHR